MTGGIRRVRSSDGVAVALHDLGGHGPTLLISHATGFHAHCYLPVAHELDHHFHTFGLDYRGHGDTAAGAVAPGVDWERFGDDAEAVATALAAADGAALIGFGHSMGGAALLMAAHRDASLFRGLVLFEPIVFPPIDPRRGGDGESPLIAGARRRRASFPSYEAAIANFAAKPPLGTFTPEALDAYVRFGFAEDANGQVHLKCHPDFEADTFAASGEQATWAALAEITTPVLVVAGRREAMQPSSFSSSVADQLPNGSYVQLDNLDHFGPMTHPAAVAELISGFADSPPSAGHTS
ncbi:MAG: alpha/beta hydrolase [Actinomycetota bacterium]|jgi:pimeloyl-ACP methyl ester carboxylesterase